uniref:Vesicle transport protein USE1 n=1 Tax=Sinocyclocheilus grahami TaxID=75366 RepID=A0A672NQK6_SINGR
MATSRLEINFIRLLSRCESLASEKRNETDWRLEKYVGALEEMLVALKKSPSKPTPEILTDYNRKVDFLKGLLEADKLPSPAEKSLANQFLAPGRTPTISSERTPASKTVHIQSKARCAGEMRKELMSTVYFCWFFRSIPVDERQSAAELDAILQHHHNLQEKLADDMLNLARNLKNNTLAAQKFIGYGSQTQKVGGALSLIFCVNVSLESTVFSYFCWFFRSIPVDERQSAAELDAILQHHHNLQEKLADDMLNLARNLKNNTLAAQNIIKQDNQV